VALAILITSFPYLARVTRLPFTRHEIQVLCWFPGMLVAGGFWWGWGASAIQVDETVGSAGFRVASMITNAVLYFLFFLVAFWFFSFQWVEKPEQDHGNDAAGGRS
jgi:hypothetical protein